MREPIVLACEALRGGRPLNMGQCVDLFELAADAEEAAAITQAYADYLEGANNIRADEADRLARSNIAMGLSYMSRDEALEIYSGYYSAQVEVD